MRTLVLVCLVAFAKGNIFNDIGHALGDVVDTVGDGVKDAAQTVGAGVMDAAQTVGAGVKDAAQTVGDGVQAAAGAVAGALPGIGETLGSTFGDIWNVAKDPLEEAGKELLIQAGKFALQEGLKLALDALAAGKREAVNPSDVKAVLATSLLAEYDQWLKETKAQILSSKSELMNAMRTSTIHKLPSQLRDYVNQYAKAKSTGTTSAFVHSQAMIAAESAIEELQTRLRNKLQEVVQTFSNVH